MIRPGAGVPLVLAGGWRDDVEFMNQTVDRLRDRVPGLRWVKPVAHGDGQLLVWDGGRHEEFRLGRLADWANENWPDETDGQG